MKNLLTFLCCLIVMYSCRSTRDMKLFQNMYDHQISKTAAKPAEYKIRRDDNLYIDIQTMNPEVDLMFAPTRQSAYGTQSNYGDLTGQYLNGYLVNERGMIDLPLIGEISVIDKTEEEAKSIVQTKVAEYYKGATIKLKILTYKFSILGEVRNPGVYYNYNKYLTILEAISMANGLSDYAHLRNVLIIRHSVNGEKSFRLDLTKKEILSSEAFYLLPNDIVYIEPDKYKNFGLNSSVYSMALSAVTTSILILTYINK